MVSLQACCWRCWRKTAKSQDELAAALETLRASRPTAVNLMNNLDRMKIALWQEEYVPALVAEALRLIDEDKRLCDAIAKAGQRAGESPAAVC
ncbi:translation initiation factor 2B subunit I [Enterobacter asburiae]|uniref:Translation initiation factor 2B subunit I n=1 Tax=Enterobacter asburiae TaxID=61645 RepID=A0A376F321_ENTAS|nr:translation initiation factor 2B subunit I [Enterobacter asburiae]